MVGTDDTFQRSMPNLDNLQAASFACCGVRIEALELDAAAKAVIDLATRERPAAIHLCNAYTLSLLDGEEGLRKVLSEGDLNFPDGMPLVWIARRRGINLRDRVYGPDLMLEVMDQGRARKLRHFLYGSSEDVLSELVSNLRQRFEGIELTGALAPPFGELTARDDEELINAVRDSKASIVWVGLGTPKQDHWVHRMRDEVGLPLISVGAAFDFHAGRTKQAPRALQRLGLEWMFRLVVEPRRLWRRYVFGNTRFLVSVVRWWRRDGLAMKD